jgi:hypothetical protein
MPCCRDEQNVTYIWSSLHEMGCFVEKFYTKNCEKNEEFVVKPMV